ncbi:MAG: hypothetical protein ACYC6N_07555 [Pirellulaceae bacterium]
MLRSRPHLPRLTGRWLWHLPNSSGRMAIFLGALTVSCINGMTAEADAPKRPNIIFILADDKYVAGDSSM